MLLPGQYHAFGQGIIFAHPSRTRDATSQFYQNFAVPVWNRFLANTAISVSALLGPRAWVENLAHDPAKVTIGAHTAVRGLMRIEPTGSLKIGEYTYIGDDTLISANAEVVIGNDVAIAHGAQIFDNSSHPVDWQQRQLHTRMILGGERAQVSFPGRPVHIGDNVWIGMHAIILAGVTVGARAIISAGAVVTSDVAADTVVGGNPAKLIKQLG
jgi:acetyltransferase-like isoleucine patch superfamily enzyme